MTRWHTKEKWHALCYCHERELESGIIQTAFQAMCAPLLEHCLLAMTSAGTCRDQQGTIDIGISRSIDGGCSWEPMRVAMQRGEWGGLPRCFNGISDACILVDDVSSRVFVFACWMHGLRDSHGQFCEGLIANSPDWAHQWVMYPLEMPMEF